MNLWHVYNALIPQYLWLFQNSRLILNCPPLFYYSFSKRTVHIWTFSSALASHLSLSNKVHVLVPAHSQQWDCNIFQVHQKTHLCTWKSSIKSHQWQHWHLQLLLSGCREAHGKCLSNEKREQVTELDVSIHEFVMLLPTLTGRKS